MYVIYWLSTDRMHDEKAVCLVMVLHHVDLMLSQHRHASRALQTANVAIRLKIMSALETIKYFQDEGWIRK